MIYPENRKLFTIGEVSRACGVSRTTLIRMEDGGFLTPYYTDPDTGYRYYDADNIASVGQYQILQELGLSRKEIADLYYRRMDNTAFIKEMREKLNRLQRLLDKFEKKMDRRQQFACSFIDLPETICWCKNMEPLPAEGFATEAYVSYGECVQAGFRILVTEPLSIIFNGDWRGWTSPEDCDSYTTCIPVEAPVGSDPMLRVIPASRAFSMIAFGDYSVFYEVFRRLLQEVDARGLEPAGPVRMIPLIAPYVGAHIDPKDFCCECVMPIKEQV